MTKYLIGAIIVVFTAIVLIAIEKELCGGKACDNIFSYLFGVLCFAAMIFFIIKSSIKNSDK